MTISATVKYLLEHPFLKQAIINYNRGDERDLDYLLNIVHIHTWQTVSKDCVRAFRQNKGSNDPIIIEAIKGIPRPETLDIRLPIPLKIEDCKVVILSPKIKHIKNYKDPKQLEIEFTTKQKAPKKFLEALMG